MSVGQRSQVHMCVSHTLEDTNMVRTIKANRLYQYKGHSAYLNTADGVADSTLLPSGDQDRKVTPPPPTLCRGTQLSVETSHTW